MSQCPDQKESKKPGFLLQCMALCTKPKADKDKDFPPLSCEKCYYTCRDDDTIEVRCKNCINDCESSSKKGSRGGSKYGSGGGSICGSKCGSGGGSICGSKSCNAKGLNTLVCTKCKQVCKDNLKGYICESCREEGKNKSVQEYELSPNEQNMNKSVIGSGLCAGKSVDVPTEFALKMIEKLDCKICGMEKQEDGTMDFVCTSCTEKHAKKRDHKKGATGQEDNDDDECPNIQNLLPCENCGVTVLNKRDKHFMQVLCDKCWGAKSPRGPLVIHNVTDTTMDLSWNPALTEPAEYVIQKREYSDGDWETVASVPGNVVDAHISGLRPGTTYEFRVIAIDPNGNLSPPLAGQETTTATGGGEVDPPQGPLTISDVNETDLILTWNPALTEPDEYLIYQQELPDGDWVLVNSVPGNITSAKITDLKPGTPYQFRVVAKRGPDMSGPLAVRQSYTSGTVKPAQGPLVVSNITHTTMDLSWNPALKKPAEYVIYKQETPDGDWEPIITVPGDTVDTTISGLKPGTTYNLRVVAKDGNGKLSEPLDGQGTTTGSGDPNAPLGPLKVSHVTPTSVKLHWKKPAKGEPVDIYKIVRRLHPDGPWLDAGKVPGGPDVLEANINDLEPDKTYDFQVVAVNKNGVSEPITSDPVTTPKLKRSASKTPHAPEKPLDVTDITPNSVILHWKPPKDGPKPKKYIVEKQLYPDGEWIPVTTVDADKTETPVNDLIPNKEYKFRVKAVNDAGESPPIESDPVKLPDIEKPEEEEDQEKLPQVVAGPRTWSQSAVRALPKGSKNTPGGTKASPSGTRRPKEQRMEANKTPPSRAGARARERAAAAKSQSSLRK